MLEKSNVIAYAWRNTVIFNVDGTAARVLLHKAEDIKNGIVSRKLVDLINTSTNVSKCSCYLFIGTYRFKIRDW